MNREEIIEQQNTYYMAGYPSRRSENKMDKEHYQLTKAKEIIKDLLQCLPKENIEGIYEITEEAEEFLRYVETKIKEMNY